MQKLGSRVHFSGALGCGEICSTSLILPLFHPIFYLCFSMTTATPLPPSPSSVSKWKIYVFKSPFCRFICLRNVNFAFSYHKINFSTLNLYFKLSRLIFNVQNNLTKNIIFNILFNDNIFMYVCRVIPYVCIFICIYSKPKVA